MTNTVAHTLVSFDPTHPFTRSAVLDVQRLHRLVMSGFPDVNSESPRAALEVLFAVRPRQADTFDVLVQSALPGDWSHQANLAGARTWDVALPATGDTQAFMVNACPVKRPTTGITSASGHRRRVVLTNPAEQLAWLERQGARGGFELVGVPQVRALPVLTSELKSKPRDQRRHPGDTFSVRPVEFTGFLRVLDSDAFAQTVRAGIGPQRAYGCGLVLTRPARAQEASDSANASASV